MKPVDVCLWTAAALVAVIVVMFVLQTIAAVAGWSGDQGVCSLVPCPKAGGG